MKLTFLVLLSIVVGLTYADHWGYPTEAPNGVIKGDEDWGGECSLGRKQSPIDLAEEASIIGHYPTIMFINYDKVIQNGRVRNTGHSIQIDISPEQEYLVTGGGLPGTFVMDQMHFHWASEHTINAQRYGLELHIVSHEIRYQNFSVAVQNKNGVAVLGILYHVSDELNKVLKNILDSAEPIKSEAGESSLIKNPFAPNVLLPKDTTDYFRYEGSLTTPTCDEAVIWTVFKESVPFAVEQIDRFKTVKSEDGADLTNNFRSLQNLNSRSLIYVQTTDEGTGGSTKLFTTIYFMLILLCQLLVNLF